jgi:hypothetical protein
MPEKLFEPLPISYRGLFADSHLVDAQQFGKSLIGTSKVANSICHELFFGAVTHDPRSYHIRFCVGPSRENGLLQELFAVVSSGQLPLFMPILSVVGKEVIQITFKAMVAKILHRKSEQALAIEALHSLAMHHSEFAQQVHRGHMRDKKWLQKTIDALAQENRSPLRELPEPVGKTVRLIQVGDDGKGPTIDEPTAEVLRSRDPLELGDPIELDVKIEGVFKTNGACKVRLLGENKIVTGKITDPSLDKPHNAYTKALDEDAPLHVVAQPTLKNGRVHKLFITSAEAIGTGSAVIVGKPTTQIE